MLILFMEVQAGRLLEFSFAAINSAFIGSIKGVYVKVIFQIYFLGKPPFAVLTYVIFDLEMEGINMSFQAIFGRKAFIATRHVTFVLQFFNIGICILSIKISILLQIGFHAFRISWFPHHRGYGIFHIKLLLKLINY